jgi:TPR repeat protein
MIVARIIAGLLLVFVATSLTAAEPNPNAKSLAEPDHIAGIRAKADKGDAESQFGLGVAYAFGAGVPEDIKEALKWYRKAADQGKTAAQYYLGLAYARGKGVAKDSAEAAKWYRKAAEQGYAAAQFNLGWMYDTGDGIARDSAEAVKWYHKAAEQGDALAQFNLGVMYDKGEGVAKDSAEAVKWYRKAADQGDASAQLNLGLMYANGEGVAKDGAEALKWLRKAAEQGHASAQSNLGRMCATGDGVAKDNAEALKWLRKAADQGHAGARSNLGLMYANGYGVAKDSVEAVKWYRKAAEQGNATAQGNLGSMYANGTGVAKDTIEGLAWSNIAAASGNEIFIKERDLLEHRVGPEATLAAQRRSKEILAEIEAAKQRQGSPEPKDSAAPEYPATRSPKASGTGAIASTEGHILTAAHVVAGAKQVKVFTAQGMKSATVLRIDEANDLAVLKLTEGKYSALPVAPSRKVRLGQAVSTIGFPNTRIQGFSPKVTRGEISSLSGAGDDARSWQISVPVQHGNSGGPLLDESGNLIGVVTAKLGLRAAAVTGDLPQNVNYAVKSAYALPLLEQYLGANAPEPSTQKRPFEDMVAKAQQSVVLILVY